ncbi:hypothetical protein LUZ61_005378 [Rhynchospora tenuis]|uniref:Cytochrome P450 71A1-like n=1 Tax=Rhynchospora tenuis TaxID=198213 RepID=A0AAD5ZPQ4_9POAL|nr:hypothetical protein LUZ61_005378 [Rhynchospora tenuis]
MAPLYLNLTSFLLLASTLLFLFFILRSKSKSKLPSINLPPGPKPLPLIGNLHQLGDQPHLALHRLSCTYGPIFRLTLGFIPTVVVSSAKLAREVMRTHDLALASRPQLQSARSLFYGCTDIAFAPYGPYWRHVRKICILELLSQRRVDMFAPVRAAEARCMISRIATAAAEGKAMNLSKILGLYANGVLGRAAFGKDFYGGGDYDRHGFQEMLEEYQVLLGGFSIGDFFPGMEWVGAITGTNARLEKTFQRFDKFFDEIIEEHMQKRRKGRIQEEGKDLVDVLLDVKESEGLEMPLTMDNVKAVILDMFAAGTDTTFISLDWGMTELLMNPGALKQAQKEVREITGAKQFVSESDLCNMPHLKAVIKEIFRLHPPAPVLIPRESMEQVTIDGYDIPTKTRIYINAWAIGRDPELWEHPDQFKPERFLDSPIDYKGQHYELIPFGAGRRICHAISFGTASVELALAQLLHSFDWELPPGVAAKDLDLTEVFGITMHRIQQLVVVAKPYLVE